MAAALRYALTFLCKNVVERDLHQGLQTTFWGTEMRNLAIVARAYDVRTRPRDEKHSLVSLACILNREALKPS